MIVLALIITLEHVHIVQVELRIWTAFHQRLEPTFKIGQF